MKKTALFPCLLAMISAAACSPQENESEPAAPVCEITSPENGSVYELEDEIVISGTGSDQDGTITLTVLKINGNPVEEVTSVPFDYTLADPHKTEGRLEITLEVTDNDGQTASCTAGIEVLGQFRECTDSRDNKTYKTVKIGDQEWFAENCGYLPYVNSPSETSKDEPRYYVYGYEGNSTDEAKASENYGKHGVLYNWLAAGGSMDSRNDDIPSGIQGPCPDGWHVPSEAEWAILYKYVRDRIPDDEAAEYWDGSMVKNVCGHLRSQNGWPLSLDDDFPQLAKGGLDTYGFCALPSGCMLSGGFYYGPDKPGSSVQYWLPHYDAVTYPAYPGGVSTTIKNYQYEPDFGRGTDPSRGFPVRCLKD